MRYGSEHKAETRSRILSAAAKVLREKGLANAAISDVMAKASLTNGGFYAHFDCKDALIAEAVDMMFVDARRRLPVLADTLENKTVNPREALRTYLTSYLSPRHRDEPDQGCPLPALAVDIARHSGMAQVGFARGLESVTATIEAIATQMGMDKPASQARTVVAQMVGAIILARAVGKGEQSDLVLRDSLADLLTRLRL